VPQNIAPMLRAAATTVATSPVATFQPVDGRLALGAVFRFPPRTFTAIVPPRARTRSARRGTEELLYLGGGSAPVGATIIE
jgi:hypothetical protein